MSIRNLAFLCISLLAIIPSVAQSHGTNGDTKVYDNSVWYNARRGDPTAMNQLGIWYYTGTNVDRDYDKAYQWWKRAAIAQNPKSIANLGVCYQYGNGVMRDSVAAIRLYLTAIEQGQQELFNQRLANTPNHAFDDMLIGLCYEKGIGTLRNTETAAQYYGYAADKGSIDGMINGARMLIQSGKGQSAINYLKKAAAADNAEAQYLLGKLLLESSDPNDKKSAAAYIRKAADADIPEAQSTLGYLYFSGNAVGRDLTQALDWLEQGAKAGDAPSMWYYGMALKEARQYDDAIFWLANAAQCGYAQPFADMYAHLPASDAFGSYIKGLQALILKDQPEQAQKLFQTAARDKSDDAKVMEAVTMIRLGNADKAAKALEKLSTTNSLAPYYLAELYLAGNGVPRDTSRAIRLYRQAASAGNGKAASALGDIYYDGHYTTRDYREATRLYAQALDARHLSEASAQHLMQIYSNGLVTPTGNTQRTLAAYDATDPVVALISGL